MLDDNKTGEETIGDQVSTQTEQSIAHNEGEGDATTEEKHTTEEEEKLIEELDDEDTNDNNSVNSRRKIPQKRKISTVVLSPRVTSRTTEQKHNNSDKQQEKHSDEKDTISSSNDALITNGKEEKKEEKSEDGKETDGGRGGRNYNRDKNKNKNKGKGKGNRDIYHYFNWFTKNKELFTAHRDVPLHILKLGLLRLDELKKHGLMTAIDKDIDRRIQLVINDLSEDNKIRLGERYEVIDKQTSVARVVEEERKMTIDISKECEDCKE